MKSVLASASFCSQMYIWKSSNLFNAIHVQSKIKYFYNFIKNWNSVTQ